GRTTEYSPDVVTGLVTCITTPDGRKSEFYYNNQNQLTSATGPDGLEMRRKYDEYGRLTQETARNGDVTRYSYDNPHSELPSATEDATGSRKQMTWSR
ncbi:RHS repeat domain-containing protein, partial [Escherichia coli]|uniref:RHS repeat domain-containing protein n=1 Tax=Escherichia coli TaxID=562 RepID=UPI0011BA4B85